MATAAESEAAAFVPRAIELSLLAAAFLPIAVAASPEATVAVPTATASVALAAVCVPKSPLEPIATAFLPVTSTW